MTILTSDSLTLPAPLGGTLVNRVRPLHPGELAGLPTLELSDRAYADLEMIATGAYSPLTGFLGEADYRSVVDNMRLHSGLPWSIPITLMVSREEAQAARGRVALTRAGQPVGLIEVSEQYVPDKAHEAREVYRTPDLAHPGVAALYAAGEVYLAG